LAAVDSLELEEFGELALEALELQDALSVVRASGENCLFTTLNGLAKECLVLRGHLEGVEDHAVLNRAGRCEYAACALKALRAEAKFLEFRLLPEAETQPDDGLAISASFGDLDRLEQRESLARRENDLGESGFQPAQLRTAASFVLVPVSVALVREFYPALYDPEDSIGFVPKLANEEQLPCQRQPHVVEPNVLLELAGRVKKRLH
jgi:hypothetical protein